MRISFPGPSADSAPKAAVGGGSSHVAAGILASRITGLIRERVMAHYFGNSAIADAFRAAIRIPNLLNNLFGEGVLSASFVMVYSRLRANGFDRPAQHLAAAVFGILALLCAVLSLAGVLITPLLIDVIAPGFDGEKRELTIRLVRILFPGTALLVMSAWCLGVLNSHRRFLLSYTAPIAMNFAMIASLWIFGGAASLPQLAVYLAWGSVVGSALQFLVQLPSVLQLLPHFRPVFDTASEHVRTVIRNFGPVFLSRGVVQISSYIDSIIASLLPTGAVAALGYGATIAILPISLFSMSVSAAELPTLSSAVGTDEERKLFLRTRLNKGLSRIAFFVVPSAIAFLALGDVVAGALYQSGKFGRHDAEYVWAVLAGSAIGLLATALGRLYSSTFYALLDTRTPLRFAIVRVVLTLTLGYLFALPLPPLLGIDQKWGVAGLTVSAGIAGWVEFVLLRRELLRRIGPVSVPPSLLVKLWFSAICAAALAFAIKLTIGTNHPLAAAIVILSVFGLGYLAGTWLLGVQQSRDTAMVLLRRLRLKR